MRLLFSALFIFQVMLSMAQTEKNYSHLIDAADALISVDANKALQYLDSIPSPLEKSINGRIGEYYLLKGYCYDHTLQETKVYPSYLLSSRYAIEENDYDTAGKANLELFTYTYFIKKDSTALKYLDAAEKYYTLSNNTNGLIHIKQMPAYVAFTEQEYDKCNNLLLENLDTYKNVTDDAYYYLFANFMLASNYIHKEDLKNANKYLKEFKSLKTNPTITAYNYNGYKVTLDICMSHLHLSNNEIDSTLYYLSSANKLRDYMSVIPKGEYFSFSAEAYNILGKEDISKKYLDSLRDFQKEVLIDNIEAGSALNEILTNSEESLIKKSEESNIVKKWLLAIGILLVILLLLFLFGYKRFKSNKDKFSLQQKDFSKLKSSNEKLKVRTQELEIYISEVKEKVKQISSINDEESQQNKIRSLYRSINAEANNYKNSGDNHINILKELNEPFFDSIKNDFPILTDTEFLVCYYLKLGFKNKEIAFFLDRSIRSVESQRYRISNKMNLENSKVLVDYINNTYAY